VKQDPEVEFQKKIKKNPINVIWIRSGSLDMVVILDVWGRLDVLNKWGRRTNMSFCPLSIEHIL
jgi:hypothetical protein